ncbi:hypothetical protein [uncultured Imperialibacter sp.]|uniref:hypothetical protein n=1 Tax=uncultured Imperialibacter sp. TaxID=1672639 RepID=UPI0030D88B9C|tara:strand:+ start:99164 stop:100093 length:930 start_codon:yes stop_codon:yes gene_type:complete
MTKEKSENGTGSQEAITEKKESKTKKCGLVMPIADTDGYPAAHWQDVQSILKDVGSGLGYDIDLVSNDSASGLIHERIVQNLYFNEMAICDVSSKNPNVMFELGMRLAFDMPTIVIKDELTDYTFDAGVIEHLYYPSSLHYHKIQQFKEALSKKIIGTQKASSQKDYSPFLKTFGRLIPKQINQSEVGVSEYLTNQIGELSERIAEMSRTMYSVNAVPQSYRVVGKTESKVMSGTRSLDTEDIEFAIRYISKNFNEYVPFISGDIKITDRILGQIKRDMRALGYDTSYTLIDAILAEEIRKRKNDNILS